MISISLWLQRGWTVSQRLRMVRITFQAQVFVSLFLPVNQCTTIGEASCKVAACRLLWLLPCAFLDSCKGKVLTASFLGTGSQVHLSVINLVSLVFAAKAQGVQIHQKGNTAWSEIFHGISRKFKQKKRSSQILLQWNNHEKIKLCNAVRKNLWKLLTSYMYIYLQKNRVGFCVF